MTALSVMLTALRQGVATIRKLAAKRRRQALMRSARMEMISRRGCAAKLDRARAGCNE
jgi:hypothetical protein